MTHLYFKDSINNAISQHLPIIGSPKYKLNTNRSSYSLVSLLVSARYSCHLRQLLCSTCLIFNTLPQARTSPISDAKCLTFVLGSAFVKESSGGAFIRSYTLCWMMQPRCSLTLIRFYFCLDRFHVPRPSVNEGIGTLSRRQFKLQIFRHDLNNVRITK